MDKTIYEEDGTRQQWDDTPVVPAQIAAFSKTVQLLERTPRAGDCYRRPG
jgi:D-alanine transfer protein